MWQNTWTNTERCFEDARKCKHFIITALITQKQPSQCICFFPCRVFAEICRHFEQRIQQSIGFRMNKSSQENTDVFVITSFLVLLACSAVWNNKFQIYFLPYVKNLLGSFYNNNIVTVKLNYSFILDIPYTN